MGKKFKKKCYLKLYFIGEEIDEEESVSEAGQDEEEEEDIPDEQTFLTKEITMEDIKRYETCFFLSYQEREGSKMKKTVIHNHQHFTYNVLIYYILFLNSRFKAKMKSVSQIMIEGDDIDMGSESDVSDTSQIRTSLVLQRTCKILSLQ